MKCEIMQPLIQFGRALKKIVMQGMSSNFFQEKKFNVTFVTFPIIGNTFEKNK